ncbi:MAG: thiamine pyrophosphate-binding protein [bacterium]|nr:thiamine pyrophosphate-binding protein [bacterium]
METSQRHLWFGNEAVAWAALHAGVAVGVGYPGTPSTEILETFSEIGGPAQWSPNEKVAMEVGLGAAFGGGRVLVTMKHVGVNVASDPLFTATHTDLSGGLVLISADDPGMHSSQNEQDNRFYARMAGVPMFEPADSQEAYDYTLAAIELSERWRMPVMVRMTTRVCHSKTVVQPRTDFPGPGEPTFERDLPARVMIPAYARPAHRRLRAKLDEVAAWNEEGAFTHRIDGDSSLGIIAAGVSYVHAREATPEATCLKIGLSNPLPLDTMKAFAESVDRCVVIEEGEAYMADAMRAAGVPVESKKNPFRFGELNVDRVQRILAKDDSPEATPPRGKPPELCAGCAHRPVFRALGKLGCIVSGDIGCYTLGVLPPFEAMDTCVCMGASIGVGLGLRHVLPDDKARRVVSVIGDSTFVHSGITGLVEMVYNPPKTGHVVMILDNGTTAMTGAQEHPGTGEKLNNEPTGQVVYEDLCKSLGIQNVHVIDPTKGARGVQKLVESSLEKDELTVIITRSPCAIMVARKSAKARKLAAETAESKCNA